MTILIYLLESLHLTPNRKIREPYVPCFHALIPSYEKAEKPSPAPKQQLLKNAPEELQRSAGAWSCVTD